MSPVGLTLNDVGTNARASSNTDPKSSRTSVRFCLATREPSSHTQNSRNSVRDRSTPVGESVWVIERQRGPLVGGRTQLGAPKFGDAGVLFASPSTVSGFTMNHRTGSAACVCPASLIVGSICCGKNWIGCSWPLR